MAAKKPEKKKTSKKGTKKNKPKDVFCHNCGKKLKKYENFCHNCGVQKGTKPVERKEAEPKEKKSPWAAALLNLVILGAGFWYLGKWGKGFLYLLGGIALAVTSGYFLTGIVLIGAMINSYRDAKKYNGDALKNRKNEDKEIIGYVIAAFIVLIVLIFYFDAFDTDSSLSTEMDSSNSQKTYNMGDTVSLNSIAYTVDEVSKMYIIGNQWTYKEASGVYYIIQIEVENLDNKPKEYFTPDVRIIDEQGREYSQDREAEFYVNTMGFESFLFEQLQPGLPRTGVVVFDVPKGQSGLKLKIEEGLIKTKSVLIELPDSENSESKKSSEMSKTSDPVSITGNTIKELSCNDFPKLSTPEVQLFVKAATSDTQAETDMLTALNALGKNVDFKIRFTDYARGNEASEEQLRQYCIQKTQNSKYLDYLLSYITENDHKKALDFALINKEKLKKCMAVGDEKFKSDLELADVYSIKDSPSLVVNDKVINTGNSADEYIDAICCGFKEKPEVCR